MAKLEAVVAMRRGPLAAVMGVSALAACAQILGVGDASYDADAGDGADGPADASPEGAAEAAADATIDADATSDAGGASPCFAIARDAHTFFEDFDEAGPGLAAFDYNQITPGATGLIIANSLASSPPNLLITRVPPVPPGVSASATFSKRVAGASSHLCVAVNAQFGPSDPDSADYDPNVLDVVLSDGRFTGMVVSPAAVALFASQEDGGFAANDFPATLAIAQRITLDVSFGPSGRVRLYTKLEAGPLIDLPFANGSSTTDAATVTVGLQTNGSDASAPGATGIFDDLAIDLVP